MNKKIFFVGSLKSSFVKNDYEKLCQYFEVRRYKTSPVLNFLRPRMYVSMLDILQKVIWCDTVFSWFASWRAVLPTIFAKMLGKKVVIVAGGYDVVYAPEINYGAYARTPDKWISRFLFKYADVVLPVSKYIQKELLEKASPKETHLIYNGVKIDKFYPQGGKVDNLVITVGEVNWSNLKRKGIEDFVRAAKYLPDANFLVVGEEKDSSMDYLKSIATNNVMFLGRVTSADLLWLYQKAKVYAQLSYHEGFGLSVAEAMLCRCIPVTSGKGALPEVTGRYGFFTPYNSPALAAMTIKKALNVNWGETFRARVLYHFSLKSRINKLRRILE